MKEITLKIPEQKVAFFMELINSLDFVKLDSGDSKEEITANLKAGFEELAEIKAGKKQATPLKDFLNEL